MRVTPTKSTRLVKVRCPHCRKTHTHGWPWTTDNVGPRTSHCGRGPYRVTGELELWAETTA